MDKQNIYLETTLFNYYFDEDRDAHADTVTLFEECALGKFEPYTSDYTIGEIEAAPTEKCEKMLGLVERYHITIFEASVKAEKLAKRYINEGVLPKGSMTDARHIAVASVNTIDMIVSLNFKHIVRAKTIELSGAINTLFGYRSVKIVTPMEVIDYEKTRYYTR